MITALISAFVGTLLWVSLHLIQMHYNPKQKRFMAMSKPFILGFPFLLLIVHFFYKYPLIIALLNGNETILLSYIYAVFLYVLFYFLFVEFFYHIERSVTLRLLVEIHQAINPISVNELMKHYNVNDMIDRRLQGMLEYDMINKENGVFKVSKKGLYLAYVMSFSCWLYQSKPQSGRL
jgi:hypothetical protein